MNDSIDFDRIAQTWLQDGPTEMPDRSLQAAIRPSYAFESG